MNSIQSYMYVPHLLYPFISSVQFSCSVMSDSFRPHGLQHARLPYPSPTPRACSNSCPSSQWCHPTISSSVIPFSSCLWSFPALGSFPMSQVAKVLQLQHQSFQDYEYSRNIHSGLISFRIDWFDLLAVQGTLKSLLQYHSSKASIHHFISWWTLKLLPYLGYCI